MTRAQKITLATVVVLVLLGATFSIYKSRSTPSPAGDNSTEVSLPVSGNQPIPSTRPRGSTETQPTSGEGASSEARTIERLTSSRIAGMVSLKEGDTPFVRYMERETGHVFDRSVADDASKKISNTTITNIEKAFWSPDGRLVVVRKIDPRTRSFESIAYSVPAASSTEITLIPFGFPKDARDLAISPDGKDIFFVRLNNSSTRGFLFNINTRKEKQLWSSPLTEWTLSWTDQKQILLTSRASSGAPGIAIALDPKTGAQKFLLEERAGLQALLAPEGKRILFTENSSSGIRTSMLTLANGNSYPFDPVTLLEKCTWGKTQSLYCAAPIVWPETALPDAWYKGLFHTADILWAYSPTGFPEKIVDGSDGKFGFLDITQVTPHTDDTLVYFINKSDGTLWRAKVTTN